MGRFDSEDDDYTIVEVAPEEDTDLQEEMPPGVKIDDDDD